MTAPMANAARWWQVSTLLLVALAPPAFAQPPAQQLLGDLNRLTYDARSAGMGGASLAVSGLASAPVENAATLAIGGRPEVTAGLFGDSRPAGALGAVDLFYAGTPEKAVLPRHFDNLSRWAARGRDAYGEISVLGTVGSGRLALFGTKGAVARAEITSGSEGGTDTVTVRGPGLEYETLGWAYGWSLGRNWWMGVSAREVRFYRAHMDFTVERDAGGRLTVDRANTTIVRGLEWEGDLSAFHRGRRGWTYGIVLRHANGPLFEAVDRSATWRMVPSLDIGVARRRPGSRDLFAADVRNVFGANGGRPVLRVGWERALSESGRWCARLGLRDGRPSAGIGWRSSHGAADLSFGTPLGQRASFTLSFDL